MLGASWRRLEDPNHSRDPRVRAVVGALAALPAPELRADFRAELRAQLVAITPRIVAESGTGAAAMVDIVPKPATSPARAKPSPARHAGGWLPQVRFGRIATATVAVLTTFALLLGGAMWVSKKSLPGDTLYGLKRASERLQLATAGSSMAKAQDYLDFATTRAQEVHDLLQRADGTAAGDGPQAGGVDAGTAQLITSTLASADSDVKSATALLAQQAVQKKSSAPLSTLTKWAPGQLSRLHAIGQAMPTTALQQRAASSSSLVTAAVNRANALAPDLGCSCLSNAPTDSLGPKPCTHCGLTSAVPGNPQQPVRPGTSRGPQAPGSSQTPNGAVQSTAGSSGNGGAPASGAAGSSSSSGGLQLPLPSLNLPLPTPTLPVSASSCGLDANIGPIGIGIGLCTLGVQVSKHN